MSSDDGQSDSSDEKMKPEGRIAPVRMSSRARLLLRSSSFEGETDSEDTAQVQSRSAPAPTTAPPPVTSSPAATRLVVLAASPSVDDVDTETSEDGGRNELRSSTSSAGSRDSSGLKKSQRKRRVRKVSVVAEVVEMVYHQPVAFTSSAGSSPGGASACVRILPLRVLSRPIAESPLSVPNLRGKPDAAVGAGPVSPSRGARCVPSK